MDERIKTNLLNWNDLVAVHARAASYNVEGVKRGEKLLDAIELGEVGDVRGKSLLHLQCHFGLDTMCWARLGARVTGADFSSAAVEQARALAEEGGIEARFVCSGLSE